MAYRYRPFFTWLVSVGMASSSLFAETTARPRRSFECNQEIVQAKLLPAYNASSRIDVRGSWDFYLDGSFLYWQVFQDNMQVAFASSTADVNLPSTSTTSASLTGDYVEPKTSYTPGFRVGIGAYFEVDNWDTYGCYTYLRTHDTTSTNGYAQGGVHATRGHPLVVNNNVFETVTQSWRCDLDIADGEFGRSAYTGLRLSLRPFFGAKAAWIRQALTTEYVNQNRTLSSPVSEVPGTLTVREHLNSWGLGPRLGFSTLWNLGEGICITGKGAASLLYTQYHVQSETIFQRNENNSTNQGQFQIINPKDRLKTLRPHFEMEMLLSWGTYICQYNWHLLLSAGYSFQALLGQNMFPSFSSGTLMPCQVQSVNGDLFVHGAIGSIRFDF